MKQTFIIKVNMEFFYLNDILKHFHPFTVYGPTNLDYDFYPETKNRREIGYVNIFCERKDIYMIYNFPWFISFVNEIPNQ